MRLKKMVMKRHRSVKDEETLHVEEQVTILIGANDHGKTNILAAIQCLNDDKPISPDDKNWDSDPGAFVELEWHFSVSHKVLEDLRDLGPPTSPVVAEAVIEATTSAQTTDTPAAANSVEVPPLPLFPISENGELIFSRDSQTNAIKIVALPVEVLASNEKEVLGLRPRVELFESPSGNVIDQVNLAQLETADFEFMQGIFRLADIWESRATIFAQNDRTSKTLDEASKRLTKILNDKWNQGKELKWKLEHTGTNGDHIVIKIQDPAIVGQYTRPSLRSSGFRTYFLLSMIIYARTKNKAGNSFIYLFDEPGTYLHPQAQLDLQRSFETIAEAAQIVYTTHSLFLVNKNYPKRNRVISKTTQGTKIDQKPFTKNWKSVRQSLGILLSNNFLIADKTLLVEGPSDIIYLLDAVKKMKARGVLDVDLNDFSIVDAGDSQNYVAMTKLMLSEGRDIVALLDGDNSGRNIETQLKKICETEIAEKRLQILLLPTNKSAEDIFADVDTLKSAVRKVYDNLVSTQARIPKAGIVIDDEIRKLIPSATTTLGKTMESVTKTWFETKEKISKLSIALAYEDISEGSTAVVSDEAAAVLQQIRTLLNLRGEKSMETGVFQEIQ